MLLRPSDNTNICLHQMIQKEKNIRKKQNENRPHAFQFDNVD